MKYLLMVITQCPPPVVGKNKNIVGKRVTKIIPVRGEELPTGAKRGLAISRHSDLLAKVRSLRAKPRTADRNRDVRGLDVHAAELSLVEAVAKIE
jgi:hypothetical protein